MRHKITEHAPFGGLAIHLLSGGPMTLRPALTDGLPLSVEIK